MKGIEQQRVLPQVRPGYFWCHLENINQESSPELLLAIFQWLFLGWPLGRQNGPGLGAELTTLRWHNPVPADAGSGLATPRMRSEYS